MSYAIADLQSLDQAAIAKLRSVGIRTSTKLLESAKDPKGRKHLAASIGYDEKCILRWANLVDRMRIKGIGEDYAGLLEAAGVDTVKELKYRNPANLAKAMAAANTKRRLVRLLPSEKAVVRWIESAKKLPIKISY
jgi:predicted flap endonuclease-1-like 5' DNA nuclease